MALDTESFNRELYDLLKVRGYKPVPLNAQNQRVKASQEADVIEFQFVKDGKDYGKAWVTLDDAQNLIVYFDDEQQESPSNPTPGVEYDDSWTGCLKHLKQWAQRRQLSFELKNKDRLGDDMRQREFYKMKEKLSEGYYPMGKKASYNDAVPNVKIVIQHSRALEEGEQRYRNVAKIFLENADGERFLAPTTRPGIARVYARHIAEGGVPNDERWAHIKSICEEYNKMSGFVRATRGKQFNESAQSLINEGINHCNNLRETLSKLTGHRGYNAYFESWTPALMEDEGDETINELFVQETVDPRIESVMPILSRLSKKISEMTEVDSLAEWADSIISEKLKMDSTTKSLAVPADEMLDEAPGAATLAHNQATEKSNLKAFGLAEEDHTEEENGMASDNLNKMAKASKKIGQKVKGMGGKGSLEPWQQQLVATAADKVDAVYHSMDDEELEEDDDTTTDRYDTSVDPRTRAVNYARSKKNPLSKLDTNTLTDLVKFGVMMHEDDLEEEESRVSNNPQGIPESIPQPYKKDEMKDYKVQEKGSLSTRDPDLGEIEHEDELEESEFAGKFKTGPAGQWRNKGPKANKPAKVGDLVGASESKEMDPDLARIIEMVKFK